MILRQLVFVLFSHDMYNFELKEDDENEDEIIEKRRQQRLAILQKYKHRDYSDSPVVSAVSSPTASELSARDEVIPVNNDVVEKQAPKVEEKVEESDMFADEYKVTISESLLACENLYESFINFYGLFKRG